MNSQKNVGKLGLNYLTQITNNLDIFFFNLDILILSHIK